MHRHGYRAPAPRAAIPVGGEDTRAAIDLGIHLAWRGGRISDHDALIARKLAPLHNVMCAAPSYIEAHGKPRVPTDLLDHNCLHYAYSSDVHEWTFLGAEGPIKVQTAGNFQVNNSEALLEALIGGRALAGCQHSSRVAISRAANWCAC